MKMRDWRIFLIAGLFLVLVAAGCAHSSLTLANYNQIKPGMSKVQVEQILGPPTSIDTKDMIIFKKTTYRYEEVRNSQSSLLKMTRSTARTRIWELSGLRKSIC